MKQVKIKDKVKRFAAAVLAVMMLLSVLADADTVRAEETESVHYTTKSYCVDVTVDTQWDGYYNATVEITNIGNKTIENWTLAFDSEDSIENIWNAAVESQKNQKTIIKMQAGIRILHREPVFLLVILLHAAGICIWQRSMKSCQRRKKCQKTAGMYHLQLKVSGRKDALSRLQLRTNLTPRLRTGVCLLMRLMKLKVYGTVSLFQKKTAHM